MSYQVNALSKTDILKLNKEATKEDYNISVSSGTITVDARSLLALFTLIGKNVTVNAPDHLNDPNVFVNFIKRISK